MCGVNDKQIVDQGRLEILEALLAAIDRRSEVSSVVAASQDADTAARAVQDLLGVSAASAVEVLNMQWRRLAGDDRKRMEDDRDATRQRLAAG